MIPLPRLSVDARLRIKGKELGEVSDVNAAVRYVVLSWFRV
jgi:hypothetical protein